MYLRLFHGRNTVDEIMHEWGFDGPIFEIKGFVHCVYLSHLWVDHDGDGHGEWLSLVDDLAYYDGKFYGDWSVFATLEPGMEIVPFDPSKAMAPPDVLVRQPQ